MLQVCGVNCEECPSYPEECKGCRAIQGKVFWVGYIGQEVCPMYKCCQDKGYEHCGGCAELPCKMWYEIKDPTLADEEHIASINTRVSILKG
ncbi:MAG: DUF3795 domain-containing protein [Deltaproteobacteria bacterium]